MKECYTCKEAKDLEEFHRDSKRPDGRRGNCKPCKQAKDKIWNDANKERNFHYKTLSKYGISGERYRELMATSDCCEVCGSETRVCYDHDHDTMEFRGVLCQKCNTGVGLLGDSLEDVLRMVDYLRRNR